MREPLEIIAEIKGFISNNNPFRFPYLEEHMLNSLTELENTLNPQQPVVKEVNKKPIVEEVVTEEVIVEDIIEEFTIEDIAEEVTVKEVTGKITTKKTKSKK
jgi:hypothetical protein